MQVEYIAGVGLAAGGTAQDERHLAVGHGVLGEVIVNNQRILPAVHEVFAHGAAGIGGQVLHGRAVGGGGYHHDAVGHGAGLLQLGHEAGDIGALLAHGHVDAVERAEGGVAALLTALILAGLGDDGVDGQGGLAGGAVADDELALAAADGDHGIDGQDTRLHRLVHTLAGNDTGGDFLHGIISSGLHGALAVQRVAEGIHHAAQQTGADGHLQQAARGLAGVAFLQVGSAADEHGAHLVFLQVHGQAHHAAGELNHLIEHGVAQAFDARDAVADGLDGAYILADGSSADIANLCFKLLYDVAHTFVV